MRRFKQLLAGRRETVNVFEIPLKRWYGDASHRCPAQAVEAEILFMSCPRPAVCLAPLPASKTLRNPRILLAGAHQPSLLRCLDGWPRRDGKAKAFFAQFIDDLSTLGRYADSHFDLAVVQVPASPDAHQMISHLVRIARQGLITRR